MIFPGVSGFHLLANVFPNSVKEEDSRYCGTVHLRSPV